jgi:flagellar capping protein FliD
MNEDSTKKLGGQQNDGFDELFQMVQAIRSELADLKQTVDARLYDTRPIWEKVQTDIGQLQEGQTSLSAGQQRFEERLETVRDEMRTGFRDLKRQFSVLNDTFLEVRADYKDLDKRVFQLEGQRP